jgi:hypothetical protein
LAANEIPPPVLAAVSGSLDQSAVGGEDFHLTHAGLELVWVVVDVDNLSERLRTDPDPSQVEKESLGYCPKSVAARVRPDSVAGVCAARCCPPILDFIFFLLRCNVLLGGVCARRPSSQRPMKVFRMRVKIFENF